MDQRQAEPDRDRREPLRRPAVRRAEDDDQEHERQDDLGDQAGQQRVAARRVLGVAVRRQAAGSDVEAGLAAGDHQQHARPDDPADHLRHDVRQQLRGREPLASPQPHRDGRIEVAARDVPDRVRHRQDGEPEGERDAKPADPDVRERRRQHRAPAPAEHQPERAEASAASRLVSGIMVILQAITQMGEGQIGRPDAHVCRTRIPVSSHTVTPDDSRAGRPARKHPESWYFWRSGRSRRGPRSVDLLASERVWRDRRPRVHNPGAMPATIRSLLFVPGHRARFYEKLAEFRPDAVIVDLEDAVPPAEKPLARSMVRERLGGPLLASLQVFVRVNAIDTPFFRDDVRGVVAAGLDGIFLPKADNARAAPRGEHAAGAVRAAARPGDGHRPDRADRRVGQGRAQRPASSPSRRRASWRSRSGPRTSASISASSGPAMASRRATRAPRWRSPLTTPAASPSTRPGRPSTTRRG